MIMKQLLAEKVYQTVYNDIYYNKKYSLNDFLIEQEIADACGVSKGTASEALHRLCIEGHIVSYPRKGYQVAFITQEKVRQAMDVRASVEALAVKLAIENASDEAIRALYDIDYSEEIEPGDLSMQGRMYGNGAFHRGLAALSGNKFIESIVDSLLQTVARVTIFFALENEDLGSVIGAHEEIIEAMLARDTPRALTALGKDLDRKLTVEKMIL